MHRLVVEEKEVLDPECSAFDILSKIRQTNLDDKKLEELQKEIAKNFDAQPDDMFATKIPLLSNPNQYNEVTFFENDDDSLPKSIGPPENSLRPTMLLPLPCEASSGFEFLCPVNLSVQNVAILPLLQSRAVVKHLFENVSALNDKHIKFIFDFFLVHHDQFEER